MTSPPNAASVALIRKGQVLLIQRAYEPYRGYWTLPGGRIEPGESIEQCATREVYEELGLRTNTLHPVLVQAIGTTIKFRLAVFATQDFDGEIRQSDEILAHAWIAPQAIGTLKTTAGLDAVLARAFALFDATG
ncbi:MAG TPA: NUDIX domain-containing protein [Arsenicitalea sp.]|jgi:ADP-ribose pyrophosphatase YjhB (NUDIX family)|nr:NUDIX domain-containing protein [Arsenicitalea sp.]